MGTIEQGSKFTYANFSSKTPRGYPSAYSEDWLVWTHRVSGILVKMEQSPISGSIERGLDINLLGQGEDDFQRAANSILSGLRAAQKVASAEIAVGPIPTASSAPQAVGTGVAGGIRVNIQNGTPMGGVIITDPPFEVLTSRVALLETLVIELRREINVSAPKEVGIGHNRGPEFTPACRRAYCASEGTGSESSHRPHSLG
jgi:hypothetical protein